MISFTAYGEPKGQPRARAFSQKGKIRMYDPATAEGWKGQIAMAAKNVRPLSPIEGPLSVTAVFLMPRPKRLQRAKDPQDIIPHVSKPDADNLTKALYDCLKQLGFFVDDSQISISETSKFYCMKGGHSGVIVRIGRINTLDLVISDWRLKSF